MSIKYRVFVCCIICCCCFFFFWFYCVLFYLLMEQNHRLYSLRHCELFVCSTDRSSSDCRYCRSDCLSGPLHNARFDFCFCFGFFTHLCFHIFVFTSLFSHLAFISFFFHIFMFGLFSCGLLVVFPFFSHRGFTSLFSRLTSSLTFCLTSCFILF